MRMLLLVSTVLQLVLPVVASPTRRSFDESLNAIIDHADKFNHSITKDFFVEDLSHLAEGGNKCEDKFFCKVYDILHKHFDKRIEEKVLVRNLKIYVDGRHPNCTEMLKDVKPTGISRPIPDLVGYLMRCIQHRNFNKTSSTP